MHDIILPFSGFVFCLGAFVYRSAFLHSFHCKKDHPSTLLCSTENTFIYLHHLYETWMYFIASTFCLRIIWISNSWQSYPMHYHPSLELYLLCGTVSDAEDTDNWRVNHMLNNAMISELLEWSVFNAAQFEQCRSWTFFLVLFSWFP